MSKLSKEILDKQKDSILTIKEQTEQYCKRNNKLEKDLNSMNKKTILKNTKSNVSFWLSRKIIFQEKQEKLKNDSDIINVTLSDELEILQNYKNKLEKIQNKHHENLINKSIISKNLLEGFPLLQEFKEIYEKVFDKKNLEDFYILEQSIISINNAILNYLYVKNRSEKRTLHKNDAPSSSLNDSNSEESQTKKLKK